jgi:hypothetical protein
MWSAHVRSIRRAAASLPPHLFGEVTYEDLHRSPEATLRHTADFLGLNWSDDALKWAIAANSSDELRRGGGTPIPLAGEFATPAGTVAEPPGFVRMGQADGWKQELSLRQRALVWLMAGQDMEEFGYASRSGPTTGFVRRGMRFLASALPGRSWKDVGS